MSAVAKEGEGKQNMTKDRRERGTERVKWEGEALKGEKEGVLRRVGGESQGETT